MRKLFLKQLICLILSLAIASGFLVAAIFVFLKSMNAMIGMDTGGVISLTAIFISFIYLVVLILGALFRNKLDVFKFSGSLRPIAISTILGITIFAASIAGVLSAGAFLAGTRIMDYELDSLGALYVMMVLVFLGNVLALFLEFVLRNKSNAIKFGASVLITPLLTVPLLGLIYFVWAIL